MAFEYGETAFNITALQVAPFTLPGTYGTSATFEAGATMSVESQADSIELKGYGKIVEIATILTQFDFDLDHGGVDVDALQVISGDSESVAGLTPNQIADLDVDVGGSGLPYIGVIGDLAVASGGNAAIGLPKAKANSYPSWSIEQNSFVEGTLSGRCISDGTRAIRIRRNETAAVSSFSTFFS